MQRHTDECKRNGVKFIFDPGKQVPRLAKEQILAGIEGCAVLIGNDYEFGMMARATGLTEQQIIEAAPLTVMTRGEEGSRVFVRGQAPVEIPIAKTAVVADPTGAGDAYLGGLALGLSRNMPLAVAARVAALSATFVIEKKGCQEHSFTRSEFAKRFIESFGASPEIDAWANG